MLKVYTYTKCDTCRKAVKFLRGRGVAFQEIPIRETPPSVSELRAMLEAKDGELRRLFNTSGGDYKALGLSEKLPSLSESEALKLLAGNGNLVKRPFAIGDGVALVGFKEEEWGGKLKSGKLKQREGWAPVIRGHRPSFPSVQFARRSLFRGNFGGEST